MNKYIFALVLGLTQVDSLNAAEYVQVTNDEVNIMVSPSDTAEVVGLAEKGMVFRLLESRTENWVSVWLSYGTAKARYIHSSSAVAVDEPPQLDIDAKTGGILDACNDWFVAESQAKEESMALETDIEKQNRLYILLYERYQLEILKKYGISTAQPLKFNMWCVINVPVK